MANKLPAVKVYSATGQEKTVTTTVEGGKVVHRVGGPKKTSGSGGAQKFTKNVVIRTKEGKTITVSGSEQYVQKRLRETGGRIVERFYADKSGRRFSESEISARVRTPGTIYGRVKEGILQERQKRAQAGSKLKELASQLPEGYVYDARTGQILRKSDIMDLVRQKTSQEMFFGKRYEELSSVEKKAVEESLKRQKFVKLLEQQLSDKLIEPGEYAFTTVTKDYRNIGKEKAVEALEKQYKTIRSQATAGLITQVGQEFEKQGYQVTGGLTTPEGFTVFVSKPGTKEEFTVEYKVEGKTPFEVQAVPVKGRTIVLGGEGGRAEKELQVVVQGQGVAQGQQQEKELSEVEKIWRKEKRYDFAKGAAEFVGGIYGKVKNVGLEALERKLTMENPVFYAKPEAKQALKQTVKGIGKASDIFFVESTGLPAAKLYKYGAEKLSEAQRALYSKKPIEEKAVTFATKTAEAFVSAAGAGFILGSAVAAGAKPVTAAAVGTAFSGVSAGIEALSGEKDVLSPEKRIRSAIEGAMFFGGEQAAANVIRQTVPSLLKETAIRGAVRRAVTFGAGSAVAEISRVQGKEGVFAPKKQIEEAAIIGAAFSVPFTLGELWVKAGKPIPAVRRLKLTEYVRERVPKRGGGFEEKLVEKGERTVGVTFGLEKTTGEAKPLLTVGERKIFGRRVSFGEFDVSAKTAMTKEGSKIIVEVPRPTTPTQTSFTREYLRSVAEGKTVSEPFEILHRFGRETALVDRPIKKGVFELVLSESEAVGGGRIRNLVRDIGKTDKFTEDLLKTLQKRSSDILGSDITFYGSGRSTIDFPHRFRGIRDIDLTVQRDPELFAKRVAEDLKNRGWEVKIDKEKPTQVYRKINNKWEKILDVHGPEPTVGESPPLASGGYFGAGFSTRYVRGIPERPFSIISTGEQYTRKVASVLEVTPEITAGGKVKLRLGPESLERRGKDIADLLDLMLKEGRSEKEVWKVYESLTDEQKALVRKSLKKFPEEAEIRNLFKERGVKIPKSEFGKFGETLKLEASPKRAISISPAQAASVSAFREAASRAFISPSRPSRVRASKSPFKSPSPSTPPSKSVSPSTSPSRSPSPSISPSPSPSYPYSVPSYSFSSIGPSKYPSPSPSESPSDSPFRGSGGFIGGAAPFVAIGGGAPSEPYKPKGREKKEIAFDITAFVKSRRARKRRKKGKKEAAPELFTGLKTRAVGEIGFKF